LAKQYNIIFVINIFGDTIKFDTSTSEMYIIFWTDTQRTAVKTKETVNFVPNAEHESSRLLLIRAGCCGRTYTYYSTTVVWWLPAKWTESVLLSYSS
jgi:hypothetical protein